MAATLIAVIGAGLSVQAIPGAGLDKGPPIRAHRPKADAYVSEANRRQNYGHALKLRIDASPRLRTYISFKVDLSSYEVRMVSLLLYSHRASQAGYQVRLVEEPWREGRITFANAPRRSPDFVSSGPLQARAWTNVDVTSLAAGTERSVSFVLTTTSPRGASFASRETGLRGPRLVVERQVNETTTRTTTTRTTTTSTLEGELP